MFSHNIDILMGGGRLRRPTLIKLSILCERNLKIYTKTHNKYAHTHENMKQCMKTYKEI